MVLTNQQKVAFYRNRKKIDNIVLREIKKRKLILFGARSLNRQLPPFLKKETKDYDVIVSKEKPEAVARQLEKKLDKKFKGNAFIVEKGKAKGVYKVKKVLGKEGVIDVVKLKEKVPFIKRKGVRVSTLAYEKQKVKESLADPKSAFRHDKDRERRDRILIFENLKKKRTSVVRKKKRFKSKFKTKPGFKVNVPDFSVKFKL